MAPISLVSIHPGRILMSDYSSVSKYLLARECNVVLERYRNSRAAAHVAADLQCWYTVKPGMNE